MGIEKMASDEDRCTNYPDFAIICSFIENFDDKVKLTFPDIDELQILLEDTDNVNPLLAKLIGQLLRRINKSVKFDKWERGLQRFAHSYSHQDGWELERFGFKKAKLECKIRVFRNLLESQFDLYKSFKDKVNLISAKDLRLQPCGRDKHGVSYWCQLDKFANLRIYKDDQDDETWTLVTRSREELVSLIDELQAESPPRSLVRETSVEESQSEATTPMILSEAPTPVGSKAATPVTSGRTSPVLDTGQPRDKLKCDSMDMEAINESDIKKACLHSASDNKDNNLVDKGGTSLNIDCKEGIKKTLLDESICTKMKEIKNSSERVDSVSEKLNESSAAENIPEVTYKKGLDLLGDAGQKEVVTSVIEIELAKNEIILDSVPLQEESENQTKNIIVSPLSSKENTDTSEQVLQVSSKTVSPQLKEEVPEMIKQVTGHVKSSCKKTTSKQISVQLVEPQTKSQVKALQDVHAKASKQEIQQPFKKHGGDASGKESVSSVKNTLGQISNISIQEPLHSDNSKVVINSKKELKTVGKDIDTVIKNAQCQFSDKKSLDVALGSATELKLQEVAKTGVKITPFAERQKQDGKTIFESLPISCSSSDVAQDLSMHSVSQDTALNLSDIKDSSKYVERNILFTSERRNYFPKKDSIKDLEKEKISLSADTILSSPHSHSQQKCNVFQKETSQTDSDVALNLTSPKKIFNSDKTKLEKESQQPLQDKTIGQGKDKPEKKTIDQIFSLSKGKQLDHIVAHGNDYEEKAKKESQLTNLSSKVVDLSASKPTSLLAKSSKLDTPTDFSKFAHTPLNPSKKDQISSSDLSIKPDTHTKAETGNSAEHKMMSLTKQSSDLSSIFDTSNIGKMKSSESVKIDSMESKSKMAKDSIKSTTKPQDDTINHEKISHVTSTCKEQIKAGIILEGQKVELDFYSSKKPCNPVVAMRDKKMASELPKAESTTIKKTESDSRVVKPESHKINDGQLNSDNVLSKGPSELDRTSLDSTTSCQMKTTVSTGDNGKSKHLPIIKVDSNKPKSGTVLGKESDEIRSKSTFLSGKSHNNAECIRNVASSYKDTVACNEPFKSEIDNNLVECAGKTVSIIEGDAGKIKSLSIQELESSNKYKSTVYQKLGQSNNNDSLKTDRVLSKEIDKSTITGTKLIKTPTAAEKKGPSQPVSVESNVPGKSSSVVDNEPTNSEPLRSNEVINSLTVPCAEPTKFVSLVKKELSASVLSESKEPSNTIAVARKEPINPFSMTHSLVNVNSATCLPVEIKEPTIPFTVTGNEPTKSSFIKGQEPTTSLIVARNEPTMPSSIASEDHTKSLIVAGNKSPKPSSIKSKEPTKSIIGSGYESSKSSSIESKEQTKSLIVAGNEPTKTSSIESKEPTTSLVVARNEPTKTSSIESKEPTTYLIVARNEPTMSSSIESKKPTKSLIVVGNELAKSSSNESKEPTKSLIGAGIEPTKCSSIERMEPIKSLIVAGNEPTKSSSIESKVPTESFILAGNEPTKSSSIESKELIKSLIVAGKEPTKTSSSESKEPITSLIVARNEPTMSSSIDSKKRTKSLFVVGNVPTKYSSIENKKPTKSLIVAGNEPTKCSSIKSKEPTKSLNVTGNEPTRSSSIESKEPTKSLIGAGIEPSKCSSIERLEPIKSLIGAGNEPTKSSSIESKEPTKSFILAENESTRSSSIEIKEPTKPLIVAGNQPTKPSSIESKGPTKSLIVAGNQPIKSSSIESKEPITTMSIENKESPKSSFIESTEPIKSFSIENKEFKESSFINRIEPTIISPIEQEPSKNINKNVEAKEVSKSLSVITKKLSKTLPVNSEECAAVASVKSTEASKSVSVLINDPSKSLSDDNKEPNKSVAVVSKELIKPEIIPRNLHSKSDCMATIDSVKSKMMAVKVSNEPLPSASNKSSKSETIVRKSSCKSDTSNTMLFGSKLEPTAHDIMAVSSASKEGDKPAIISGKLTCKSAQVICKDSVKFETKAANDDLTSVAITCKEIDKTVLVTKSEPFKIQSVLNKDTDKPAAIAYKDSEKMVMNVTKEDTIALSLTVPCKESSKSSVSSSSSPCGTQNEEIKSESSKELLKITPVKTNDKPILTSAEVSSKPDSITSEKLNKSKVIPLKCKNDTVVPSHIKDDKAASVSRNDSNTSDFVSGHQVSYKSSFKKLNIPSSNIISSKSESTEELEKFEKMAAKESTNSLATDKSKSIVKQKLACESKPSSYLDSSKLGSSENKVPTKTALKETILSGSESINEEDIVKHSSSKSDACAAKIVLADSKTNTSLEPNLPEVPLCENNTKSPSIVVEEYSKPETLLSKEGIVPIVVTGDLSESIKKDKLKLTLNDKSLACKTLDKSESYSSIGSCKSPVEPIKSDASTIKEVCKTEPIKSFSGITSESPVDHKHSKPGFSSNSNSCQSESFASNEISSSKSCDADEHCKFSSTTKTVSEETIENKCCDIAVKVTDEKPESLVKNLNLSESVSCQSAESQKETVSKDIVSNPVGLKDISIDKKEIDSKVLDQESDVGETIEEPLMIVTGDGEGALCEGGNYFSDSNVSDENLCKNCFCSFIADSNQLRCNCASLYSRELADFHVNNTIPNNSSIPWWENFEVCYSEQSVNNVDVIEEKVQYIWGEGSGVDCDAGNSGDENEGSVIATRSSRRNTRSAIKKSEIPENSLEESSNESKLNGVKINCQQNDIAVPSKFEGNCTSSPEVQNVAKISKSCVKGENVSTDKCKLIKENKESNIGIVASDETECVKMNKELKNRPDKSDSKEVPEKNITQTVIGKEVENKEETTILKNQRLKKKKTETEQSNPERENKDLKCDNEEIYEENVAEKTTCHRVGFRGRGRPKKARRRGIPKRGRSASHDEDKDEIEDSSEDEGEKKGRQRGKGRNDITLFDEAPSQRQRSARIAKIREREETERRELEAQRMRQMAEEHRLKELKKKARVERRALREIKKTKKEKKKDKKKKKKNKKVKKKVPTGTDPWNHSSSSSSSSSEEDELEMEEEENEELVFKSDHEFSPESDIGEEDAQPIKRARTARKSNIAAKEAVVSEEDSDYDDTQCVKCGHEDHPETILLCDSCDNGWHISCLRPPLFSVPEGDWSCPTCEHAILIKKLKEILDHYDATKKKAETEELRKQRLAYINVSLDNVIPDKKKKHKHEDEGSESDSDESESESDSGSDSSSSSEADSDSSSQAIYTLRARPSRTPKEQVENFDELINEAIRDEMEAALMSKKTPVGRGKDISTIVEGEKEDAYEDEEEEEEKDEEEEVGKGTGKEMRIEEEENERMRKNENKEEENKEFEIPNEVVKEEPPKPSEEEVIPPKKEVRIAEDDDEEVAPKRKKKKLNDDDVEEEDVGSEYEVSEPEAPPSYNKKKRMGNKAMMASKKRRRLTDLDVEEDEDDSDEDFMGTSEEDEEEEEASDAVSSDLESESESDDSGSGRGRSGRYGIVPLRRSTRNTRNTSLEDYDSDDKKSKKQKKKKKKKKRKFSSSEDEEYSSDSEGSYARKRKTSRKRSVSRRSRGKKSSSKKKKGSSRKPQKKKRKVEDDEGVEGEEKPKPKPRIKYSKPPKTKEEQQEEVTQRRVTRGRQINYYNSLLMSDEEFDDEEEKPKSRGKVMKGERVSESSSEFEVSDDERKKRRGVSGGLGKGKVMKGEEEDEDYRKEKKKVEETPPSRGKPKSAILPPKLPVLSEDAQQSISTNFENLTSESQEKISSEEKCLTPSNPILVKGPPSINQAPIRMTVNRPGALPTPTLIRGGGPGSRPRHPTPLQSHLEAKMYNRPAAPSLGSRFPLASQIQIATSPTPIVSGISSSVSITPVSYVPNPNAPHVQSHIRPNNSVTMTPRGPSPRGPRPQISMPPSIPSHVTITRGPRGPPPAPNITATTERISPPVTAIRGPASLPPTTNGNRLPLTTSVSKVESKGSSARSHPLAPVTLDSSPLIPARNTAGIPNERQALSGVATSAKKLVQLGPVSPGPLPSIGKWSPHITGGNGGSNTPPHHGLASGTPPHPNVGSAINSSPPPPYRLSPIPVSVSGTGPPNVITHRSTPPNMSPVTVQSTGYPIPSTVAHRSTPPNLSSASTHPPGYPPSTIAHRSTPPNLPPTTVHPASYPPPSTISHRSTPPNLPPTTTHPAGYPPYPPPEHFGPHPGYPPGYHPGAAHSPGPHGPPSRHNLPHPGSINASHPMYGPPVSHASSYQSLPPHHPGVLRGPIHELYRHSPPGHPRPLLLKQGYPGLEPLPYPGSPGPIDVSGGRHNSPGPPITSKELHAPPNKKPSSNEGEFSSGLMSYFSSQREDDVE